jgi:hypothetical protein
MSRPPPECANCGADIPPRAHACPECGADEKTGWRDSDVYDGLDLPADAWGEDESSPPQPLPRELPWYWWAAGLAVLIGFILSVLGAG